MESAAQIPEDTSSEPQENNSEDGQIEQIRTFLNSKDDTSRFVGLALLKSVLDNKNELIENQSVICKLWGSISPKFLDRLLRAQIAGNGSKDEARGMVDLAVAVLHTFTIILPDDMRRQDKLIKRIGPLVNAIVQR